MVVGWWKIDSYCFPQVLAITGDLESDSGLTPVPLMDGHGVQGCQVGFMIDLSVNLVNPLHYYVHNALQGFSIWTEEISELLGNNWY